MPDTTTAAERIARHRPRGYPWDAIAALWWPPGSHALVPDAPLARALGCTPVAVRVARARRGCGAWRAPALPSDDAIRAELVAKGIVSG